MFLTHQSVQIRKALSVKVSHRFGVGSAVFDEDSLVSCAGLVPVMTLAEQAGLARLLDENLGALANLDFTPDELREIDQYASDSGIDLWRESSDV